jgi:hypothetical protein
MFAAPRAKERSRVMGDPKFPKESFDVSISGGQSFGDLVSIGQYDWISEQVTAEHFPVVGSVDKQDFSLQLVHLGHTARTDEIENRIVELGLESAKIEHLLALRAAYRTRWQDRFYFNLAALGSGWVNGVGLCHAPCLIPSGSMCFFYLNWSMPDFRWENYWRFLTVRRK